MRDFYHTRTSEQVARPERAHSHPHIRVSQLVHTRPRERAPRYPPSLRSGTSRSETLPPYVSKDNSKLPVYLETAEAAEPPDTQPADVQSQRSPAAHSLLEDLDEFPLPSPGSSHPKAAHDSKGRAVMPPEKTSAIELDDLSPKSIAEVAR